MDEKQKQFFAAMESLFESDGWELISRGWQEEVDRLPEMAFYNAKDFDDVREARIRAELLQQLLDMPNHIERQKAAILENLTDE